MRSIAPPLFLLLAVAAMPVSAQNTVAQAENVRMDYAQVLRVEPVYQTLTGTRMEPDCGQQPTRAPKTDAKGLSRLVGAVKGVLLREDEAIDQPAADKVEGCRMVPVQREFRRPIAFDVDYLYKGGKYRSRLPEDPGNRLRVRVSVTPYVQSADQR